MKHLLHKCVIILCVVSLSVAFANSFSRLGNVESRPTINLDNVPQYVPASRQYDVLFVADIAGTFGPATQPDPLWDSLLTELVGTGNYGWFTTDSTAADGPDLATMELYDLVIWNCYDYWFQGPMALTPQDQLNVSDLLFNGGKLWLIGQDVLWSGVPMAWMNTHFHLAGAVQDYNYSVDSLHAQGTNEISGYSMTVISDYASNPLFTDELIPDTLFAHGVIEDIDSNKVIGIYYPGQMDWQSAFWAVDLRDSLWFYWGEIIGMVGGMLGEFGVTGIDEFGAEPVRHFDLNISPDPFVRTTTISFEVPNAAHVRLDIFNKAGQYVTNLMDSRQSAGTHQVNWNRRDARGMEVPNGVYFVRLTCDDVSSTANIVVTK